MERRYLSVPPEEASEVQAIGARWDPESLCWYIYFNEDPAGFSKWLPNEAGDSQEWAISSDQAFVASTTVTCLNCHSSTDVICLYCESGIVSGEVINRFTVSHVWAMANTLARQLEPWPTFREIHDAQERGSCFANHCSHCGTVQEDIYLHSEPGDPFFDIPHAPPGAIKLTQLVGWVQLSGDESFEI